jgi:hypothetical protein
LEKYQSQEVASNKLEKGTLIDFKTVFCSSVALMVREKKIFKDLASFCGFSLHVWKIFGITEPYEQILERTTQGIFLQKKAN